MKVLLRELKQVDAGMSDAVQETYSKLIFKGFTVVNDTKNPLKSSYSSEGVSVSMGADYSAEDLDTLTSEGVLCVNALLVYLNRKSQILSWFQCGIINKAEFAGALRNLLDGTVNSMSMIFGVSGKVAQGGKQTEVSASGFANSDEQDLDSVCESKGLEDDGKL